MNTDELAKTLDVLRVNLEEGQYKVLRAILMAQDKTTEAVTFSQIQDQMIAEKRKKMSRPLAYRYLKALENRGYIEVVKGSYRNEYKANYNTIMRAIQKSRHETMENLWKQRDELESKIEYINNLNLAETSTKIIELLAEKEYRKTPRSATGLDNIHRLTDAVLYSKAKKGDVIRVTYDWVQREDDIEKRRLEIGRTLLQRGLVFRTLVHNERSSLQTDLAIIRAKEYKLMKEAGFKVDSRVSFESDQTYQIIALNKEGIVLIVSEEPVTAVWIPRSANALLVDEAIERFDEHFNSAKDMHDVVAPSEVQA
ncbi:MAG: hypothetical protein ACXABC_06240 [Candidatus Thorarchaeota archaeon]